MPPEQSKKMDGFEFEVYECLGEEGGRTTERCVNSFSKSLVDLSRI